MKERPCSPDTLPSFVELSVDSCAGEFILLLMILGSLECTVVCATAQLLTGAVGRVFLLFLSILLETNTAEGRTWSLEF